MDSSLWKKSLEHNCSVQVEPIWQHDHDYIMQWQDAPHTPARQELPQEQRHENYLDCLPLREFESELALDRAFIDNFLRRL